MNENLWRDIFLIIAIPMFVGFIILLGLDRWADMGTIVCNDTCAMERRMAQVQWCVEQETLTRFECAVLAGPG